MVLAAIEAYGASDSLWMAAAAGAACVGAIFLLVGTAMNTWLQGRAARVDSAWLFGGTIFGTALRGGWGPLLMVLSGLIWRARPVESPARAIGHSAAVA